MSAEARPSLLQIAIRVALGLLAFGVLWRVPEPRLLAIPTANTVGLVEPTPISTLLLEVVVGTVAGTVFALAARPIWSDWTFRWQLPLALGLIPALILAIEALTYSGVMELAGEGAWTSFVLFLISSFSLRVTAVLLGVALAQGVVSADEGTDVQADVSRSRSLR